jgi:hypothetical protein
MRGLFGAIVACFLLVACNNGGGTASPLQRCMTQCNRVNTACMATTDCTMFCAQVNAYYASCSSQTDAFLSCAESATNAQLCSTTNPCDAQQNAYGMCIAAHTDAGTGGDV